MISVSENLMVESECFLQNKVCPFLGKVFVFTLVILFIETQLDIFSYDVPLLNNFVYCICPIELEKNGYHKYRYVCFIP
jgi:hypothetical protein